MSQDHVWEAPAQGEGTASGFVSVKAIGALVIGTQLINQVGAALISLLELAGESTVNSDLLLAVMGLIGIGVLGSIMLGVPLWGYWHYRAAANLRALGRTTLSFTPASHVWWWFVPFANLVMPYRALQELYCASVSEDDDWLLVVPPSTFPLWWGAYLAANVTSNLSLQMDATGIDGIVPLLSLISAPLGLIAVGLYAQYVWTISTTQEHRALGPGMR